MSDRKATLRALRVPAPEFLTQPEHLLLSADHSCLVGYDRSSRAGLVYYLEPARWQVLVPVSFAEFAVVLTAMDIGFTPGDDLQRWLTASALEPLGPRAN